MFEKVNKIMITGDTHGSSLSVIKRFKRESIQENDIIIVCGDFGANYGNTRSESLRETCNSIGGKWIVVRGNHDTRYWRDFKDNKNYHVSEDGQYLIENKYPNIYYVKDEGGLYSIGDYNFLMIPGAFSVDGELRKLLDYPFEPEEQLTQEEMNKIFQIAADQQDKIDFVIAHTFPEKIVYSNLIYLFMDGVNQSKVDNTMEYWLNNVMEILEKNQNFKQYFGGHFHDSKTLNEKYIILFEKVVDLSYFE